uniref:Sugar phosphate transporter domain-containing protein n=1 Tax=Chromera velia CCMP2878 TaxID=1169474 RepID=A0A0G4GJV2_9ALVE|eukprot:Cvel_22205.t1-p1 / transcript=Cvel_22205.t1 / gene=Cvel_22205 / organism=Chromera_velia_CCMP2878 / gene_product=hypothetical protein / transcript_product=hypothetical protein / location=Cvel_scaffold2157:22220-26428(+) / protein_length=1080 / sequence_SO=supercontig / SO=protein_coding / is_pseudo=false
MDHIKTPRAGIDEPETTKVLLKDSEESNVAVAKNSSSSDVYVYAVLVAWYLGSAFHSYLTKRALEGYTAAPEVPERALFGCVVTFLQLAQAVAIGSTVHFFTPKSVERHSETHDLKTFLTYSFCGGALLYALANIGANTALGGGKVLFVQVTKTSELVLQSTFALLILGGPSPLSRLPTLLMVLGGNLLVIYEASGGKSGGTNMVTFAAAVCGAVSISLRNVLVSKSSKGALENLIGLSAIGSLFAGATAGLLLLCGIRMDHIQYWRVVEAGVFDFVYNLASLAFLALSGSPVAHAYFNAVKRVIVISTAQILQCDYPSLLQVVGASVAILGVLVAQAKPVSTAGNGVSEGGGVKRRVTLAVVMTFASLSAGGVIYNCGSASPRSDEDAALAFSSTSSSNENGKTDSLRGSTALSANDPDTATPSLATAVSAATAADSTDKAILPLPPVERVEVIWAFSSPPSQELLEELRTLVGEPSGLKCGLEVSVLCGSQSCIETVEKYASSTSPSDEGLSGCDLSHEEGASNSSRLNAKQLLLKEVVRDTPGAHWLAFHPLHKIRYGVAFEGFLQELVVLSSAVKKNENTLILDPRTLPPETKLLQSVRLARGLLSPPPNKTAPTLSFQPSRLTALRGCDQTSCREGLSSLLERFVAAFPPLPKQDTCQIPADIDFAHTPLVPPPIEQAATARKATATALEEFITSRPVEERERWQTLPFSSGDTMSQPAGNPCPFCPVPDSTAVVVLDTHPLDRHTEPDVRKNLGDMAQGFGSMHYLPRVDTTICRDKMADDAPRVLRETGKENIFMVANAWYGHWEQQWPPHESTRAVMLAVHLNPEVEKPFRSEAAMSWYKSYVERYGPIGVRDVASAKMLSRKPDVPHFFSTCCTLLMENPFEVLHRLGGPPLVREGVVVSDPKLNMDGYKTVVPERILNSAILATQESVSADGLGWSDFDTEFCRLLTLAKAKLVVTTRIHVALPSVAFGTPVVFLDDGNPAGGAGGRLEGLMQFFHTIHTRHGEWVGGVNPATFNWDDPPPNPANDLRDQKRREMWQVLNKFPLSRDAGVLYGLDYDLTGCDAKANTCEA